MKDQVRKFTTNLLWLILLMFGLFIVGSFLSPEAKGETMTEVRGDKNPALKKYHKKQKSMEFQGFKKRKGKYRIR
jgi:hypothetical protein